MFAPGKKVISFKSSRKLFPDAKVSPFYITGNGRREMLVAGGNFISAITFPIIIRWQMDSLCVCRGQQPFHPSWLAGWLAGGRCVRAAASSRSPSRRRRGKLSCPGWHNTTGDKPAAGKSIFDRTPRVFQPLAPALRRRGFRPEWSSGPEVEERVLRFTVPIRTIALTSSSLCTDEFALGEKSRIIVTDITEAARNIFKKLILGT